MAGKSKLRSALFTDIKGDVQAKQAKVPQSMAMHDATNKMPDIPRAIIKIDLILRLDWAFADCWLPDKHAPMECNN